MGKVYQYAALLLVALVLSSLSYGLGASWTLPLERPAVAASSVIVGAPEPFKLVGEAWQILKEDYVERDKLEPYPFAVGAIRGMVDALGDPHTTYIDAESYKLERSSFEGRFHGIGATVTMADGRLLIVAPIAGSPAQQAGLLPGDAILEVDGRSTQGMTLAEAVNLIRGPRGTKVTLTILRQGETTPKKVEIVRDEILRESVFARLLPENIAHIRITQFTDRTNDEMKRILKEVKDQKAIGLILDLRNNPGGLLEETVQVTSQFLKDGVVLYELTKEGQRKEWRVRPRGEATEIPLAVLVNRGSASGSEVFAGAIQDYQRGPLIGERTFGKGAVNHARELSDQSALYVTIARWLTPKGRQIEGQGLTPDVELLLSPEDVAAGRDPQMEKAIAYIKSVS